MNQYWCRRTPTILLAELAELEDWINSDRCQENQEEIEAKLLSLRMEIGELLEEQPDTEEREELLRTLAHTSNMWFQFKNEGERSSIENQFLIELLTPDANRLAPNPTPSIDDDAGASLLSFLLTSYITTSSVPGASSDSNRTESISDKAPSSEENFPGVTHQEIERKGYESRAKLGQRTMSAAFRNFEFLVDIEEAKRRKMSPTSISASTTSLNHEFWLKVERKHFNQASIVITTFPNDRRTWKISIRKAATPAGPVYNSHTKDFLGGRRLEFPIDFEPGHHYEVEVEPVEVLPMDQSQKKTIRFKADFSIADLVELHQKAVTYTSTSNAMCAWFYRTKSPEYFDDIKANHSNMMNGYLKDNSGDAASPINLRIDGCFFLANVKQGSSTGEPVPCSYFGTVRISILATEILSQMPNVFFSDFYCMNSSTHQVTLVLTKPGSETDQFCEQRLLRLNLSDPSSSPFLHLDSSGQLRVSTQERLIVELLITESLSIGGFPLTKVKALGKGSSTPGGIPKNPACTLCNLHRPTPFQKF